MMELILVYTFGLIRVVEPPQVRCDDMEALSQRGNLVSPGVPERPAAVQEQQKRSLALFHVVQPDPVSGGKTMGPGLRRHKDVLSAVAVDSAVSDVVVKLPQFAGRGRRTNGL